MPSFCRNFKFEHNSSGFRERLEKLRQDLSDRMAPTGKTCVGISEARTYTLLCCLSDWYLCGCINYDG